MIRHARSFVLRISASPRLRVLIGEVVLDVFANIIDLDIEFALGLRDRIARQDAADRLDLADDLLPKSGDPVRQSMALFLFWFVHFNARSILGDFLPVVRTGWRITSVPNRVPSC